MATDYPSMLLQMPDSSILSSAEGLMPQDQSHSAEYIAAPSTFVQVASRQESENAQDSTPEGHESETAGPGLKDCSKCKLTRPVADYFRDKSKPDGLYSQCKSCATSEERRRREERAPVASEHAKQAKKCTRCHVEKDIEHFCRNSRSFDGRYSQCRTCVANKDKNRRQMLVERRDDPVASKVCSKCNTCKENSEFYRDSSKPDGLQTYCKRCLCDKHKDTRKRKRKSGPENLAGCVAFADGEQVPISGDPALVSLGSSQMHCVDDSYHLQGETTEDHSGLEAQDGYAADVSFGAAPEEDYDLQPQQQQQRYTGEEPDREAFEAGQSSNFLHAGEDFSAPSTFHQEAGTGQFMCSGAFTHAPEGPFQVIDGHPIHEGSDTHARAHDAAHFQSSPGPFQQRDSFHEQEVYQSHLQYLPDQEGYDMEEHPSQDKRAESDEPSIAPPGPGYLNPEIQQRRTRLAAIMPV